MGIISKKAADLLGTPLKQPDIQHTNNREQYFMSVAASFAEISVHPQHQVGALIVDRNGSVVSEGWNKYPVGSEDCQKVHMTHAEAVAIIRSVRSTAECTMYITHPPCSRCCAMMAEAGVSRVVHRVGSFDFLSIWGENCAVGLLILRNAGIEIKEMFEV
jgi:dCMP deaminase